MEILNRECTKCGEEKQLSEFYNRKGGKHGKSSHCITCASSIREENKDKNNARFRMFYQEHGRSKLLFKKYGITLADYDSMCKLQNGQCKICKKEVNLVVDHCHQTGKVRGLLCAVCNLALGQLEYFLNSNALDNAVSYLKS